MKKVTTLSYEQSEVTGDEGKRWVEAAFDALFEEIFAQKDSNVDRRLPNNLARTYGMEVVGNG